jgi:uncharacterized protein YgiM (DUF1202 family)
MKSPFLACICIVLLTACSGKASGTATATLTELPTSTQVLLPTSTLAETLTLTPAGLKYCVVPNLLNLRSGPGTQYSIVSIEAQSTCGQVTARNADSSWVYISTGKFTGWAFAKYLTGEGDLSTLPVLTELTPTP